ncbi:hypothetical protein [Mammaliicoccus vitulinus]|uniref:hypothetical protein n=1 Tax=Mammaliicoccus vitulinus TaxID=71237 RepID=UPI001866CDBD|nr:hypothetical protein [Mammaliicoccus vitulinus]
MLTIDGIQITEDTIIPAKIVEVNEIDGNEEAFYLNDCSINSFKDEDTQRIYIEHDDKLALIWTKEKGLVS